MKNNPTGNASVLPDQANHNIGRLLEMDDGTLWVVTSYHQGLDLLEIEAVGRRARKYYVECDAAGILGDTHDIQ